MHRKNRDGPDRCLLLAAVVVLGLFTLRSTILLSFFNVDGSTKLLAQRTSTPTVRQIVERVSNLSRGTRP